MESNDVNYGPPRTTLAAFAPTGLKKGDRVTCEMTSSDNCITKAVVESTPIIIDDIPVENPAVILALNTAKPCEGTPLMFTAAPKNAGDAPTYQWYVNNAAVTGAVASTFTSATLKNDDQVTCSVVSNAKICQVSPVGASQPFVVQHIPLVMPEVSISANTTVATIGTAITFTASINNGGPAPQYVWKVNGIEAASGNGVFTSSTFRNGDQITCTLISNADCTASNTVVSDTVTVQINIPVVASSPNIFTPNGDGVNDTWAFPGQQAYPDARLKIYNRNGQMVFHAVGNAGAWAGVDDSGAACPGGVYYYLVNLAAGKVISGAVTIIR
ncbi:T9SS type B sorting domain-containing protein [Mucilaginibacter psychrotolerans]|uniref:T9SS type B sorting domain-containing protein n=1 Tax=Mucilaginibacter psychrotolerans TaxID=1524096 RepID=A0A4Y8SM67_9SPHI|nr:gliding motility-associated C-terminal domain-containing protein [Mucilaginibacter psychrotolerans]TFF40143.1 T9SS type B sorting domain-containing protein [Mucilaginibacter psychrotolerans]